MTFARPYGQKPSNDREMPDTNISVRTSGPQCPNVPATSSRDDPSGDTKAKSK